MYTCKIRQATVDMLLPRNLCEVFHLQLVTRSMGPATKWKHCNFIFCNQVVWMLVIMLSQCPWHEHDPEIHIYVCVSMCVYKFTYFIRRILICQSWFHSLSLWVCAKACSLVGITNAT